MESRNRRGEVESGNRRRERGNRRREVGTGEGSGK